MGLDVHPPPVAPLNHLPVRVLETLLHMPNIHDAKKFMTLEAPRATNVKLDPNALLHYTDLCIMSAESQFDQVCSANLL